MRHWNKFSFWLDKNSNYRTMFPVVLQNIDRPCQIHFWSNSFSNQEVPYLGTKPRWDRRSRIIWLESFESYHMTRKFRVETWHFRSLKTFMTTTMMPIMNFLMIIHMLMSCPRKSLVKITNRTLLICMLLANLDILMIFHMQSMKVFWRLFYLKDHMLRNGSTVVFLISFRYLADLFLVRFRFSNRKRTIERSYQ